MNSTSIWLKLSVKLHVNPKQQYPMENMRHYLRNYCRSSVFAHCEYMYLEIVLNKAKSFNCQIRVTSALF